MGDARESEQIMTTGSIGFGVKLHVLEDIAARGGFRIETCTPMPAIRPGKPHYAWIEDPQATAPQTHYALSGLKDRIFSSGAFGKTETEAKEALAAMFPDKGSIHTYSFPKGGSYGNDLKGAKEVRRFDYPA